MSAENEIDTVCIRPTVNIDGNFGAEDWEGTNQVTDGRLLGVRTATNRLEKSAPSKIERVGIAIASSPLSKACCGKIDWNYYYCLAFPLFRQ